MTDVESTAVKLAELLRHPEDLDKIPALKAEFTRKKAAIDGQLRHGLKDQLEVTQAGMTSITEGQRTVNLIKEEMMKIDKLCAEAQNMIHDFPHINLVAQTHRNFEQVEKMKRDIDSFQDRIERLEMLLGEDDQDPANQPNLLQIHYELTQLREIREEAMDQIDRSEEATTELIENLRLDTGATVQEYFNRLDDVIEWFDTHVGEACVNLIELVQAGNDGLVVRLALVIEEEERSDKKVKALQDAQREYKDLASRLKSIATGPKQLRGYKDKFLASIKFVCEAKLEQVNETFMEDPDKLEKSVKWYFNNLNTVKLGMHTLMPKKWKIFKTYCNIYHDLMHEWLVSHMDDPELRPPQILAIINWVDKYYAKMRKLGVAEEELSPHLIDNRSSELVREYRSVIIKKVDEWMNNMSTTDRKSFLGHDRDALGEDENGLSRTKTIADMWNMLQQQLFVAASSDRTDVAEGVIEAMFRALTSRQRMWESLIAEELARYSLPGADQETLPSTQEWLVAIANDSIACIDDNREESDGIVSYLTLFERQITPMVSPAYLPNLNAQVETLRNGYIDLGTNCMKTFAQLVFAVDFKAVMTEFFTPSWYGRQDIRNITYTLYEYIRDFAQTLHFDLLDILANEFCDELLVAYLSAVRNKNAKFKRVDPFTQKMGDDVRTVFRLFQEDLTDLTVREQPIVIDVINDVKQKWRVVKLFNDLLESDKAAVPQAYQDFKMAYWDVQIGWVEAVLRSRDDFERSMLNNVKARAAEVDVERGPETIMNRVK